MKRFFSILVILFSSSFVFAQTEAVMLPENTSSLKVEVPAEKAPVLPTNENRIVFDAAPILNGGVGVAFAKALSYHTTVGPRLSFFNLRTTDAAEIRHQITSAGAEARYFVSGTTNSSVYFVAGVLDVNVTTKAQFAGTVAGSATKSDVGGLAGLGYQYIPDNAFFRDRLFLNAGAFYGSGYTISATAASVNKGPTTVSNLKIEMGPFCEVSLGMLF